MTIRFVPLHIETRTPREIREDICRKIAGKHGCSLEEMYGRSRLKIICAARHEAWACLYAHGLSLGRIGRIFGRDHTTILSGIRKVRALAQQEAAA